MLLDGWLKMLAPAVHIRKAEIRKQDEEEQLSAGDLRKIINSEQGKVITKEMLRREKKAIRSVTKFAKFRDNLMLRMLCKAAQRPGALANLTVEEFKNGVMDDNAEPRLFTTQTFFHKTSASEGEATLFWNSTNYRLAKIYLNKLRPLVVTCDSAKLPPIPGASQDRDAFFVSFKGKSLTGGQITRRIDFVKTSCPDVKGRIKGSRIRKVVVSSHREDENAPVSAIHLTAQMTHNVKTADKYYHLDDKMKHKLKVGSYLEKLTQDQDDSKDDDGEDKNPKSSVLIPCAKGFKTIFSEAETKIVEQATAHLNNNATRNEILVALERKPEAGLTEQSGRFKGQQLCDKFKSIRRSKK